MSSRPEHANQDHARENARALELLDADWRARSMAATAGWQPPPPAQSASPAPSDQGEQSSLAAGLGAHAERSMQQPSLFLARSEGANSSLAGSTREQDLGSQDDLAAELSAQAAAATDCWHAAPAISSAARSSGTDVKELPSGGVDILLHADSSTCWD